MAYFSLKIKATSVCSLLTHFVLTLDANSYHLDLVQDKIIKDIQNLLAKHKKVGIFAINDNVASYIYQTALTNNIKVPEQLSIVGFDNSPIAKKLKLTTIEQNTDKLAETSGKKLIQLLKAKILEHKILIPVSLIVRKTS